MKDSDITAVVDGVTDDFMSTYNKICLKIIQARRSEKYFSVLGQNQIKASINNDLNKLQATLFKKLESSLTNAVKASVNRAKQEMGKVESSLDVKAYSKQAYKSHQFYISHQISKSKNDIERFLKADLLEFNRYRRLHGVTRRQAVGDLGLTSLPAMKFVDKRGYNWDAKQYFQMLFHTVVSQSRNQAFMDMMEKNGKDLVRISSHGAKDACSRWEGKIISLSGATEGYPTYSDVRATKECFHPRCRHFLTFVDMEGRNESEN